MTEDERNALREEHRRTEEVGLMFLDGDIRDRRWRQAINRLETIIKRESYLTERLKMEDSDGKSESPSS